MMENEKNICLYSKPEWKKYNSISQKRSFIYRIEGNKVFIKEGVFENEYELYTNKSINKLAEKTKNDQIPISNGFIFLKDDSTKINTTKKILFRFCVVLGYSSNSEFVNLSFYKSTIDVNFGLCHFNNPPKSKIAQCLSFSDCIIWNLQFNFCKFVNEVNFSDCKDSDSISFDNCSNKKGELEREDRNVNKISIRSCEFEWLSISAMPNKKSELKEFDIDDAKINDISIMNTDLDYLHFSVCNIGKFLCLGSINSLVFISSILNDNFTTTLPEKYFKNPYIIKQIKMLDCTVNFPLRLEKFKGSILDLSKNSFNNDLSISFDTKNITQKKPNDTSENNQNILVLNHSNLKHITTIDTSNIDKIFMLGTKIFGYLFLTPNNFLFLRDKLDHTGFVKDNDRKKIFKNKKSQYLLLCDAYKKNGEFENEDLAWVEYMKVSGKLSKCYIKPLYYFLDILGKFGTSIRRILFSITIVLLFFSFLYYLLDIVNTKSIMLNRSLTTYCDYLYFSIVTFITIGYGDLAPLHWIARLLACFEGFLGVFLIAYMTIAVFRKFTRK